MRLLPLAKVLALALPILFFALFGLALLRATRLAAPVPYAEFQRLLAAGRVERVVVRQDQAEVTLKPPQASRISVRLPDPQRSRDGALDSALIGQLAASGVDYRFEAPGQGLAALLNVLPVLLLFGLPAALLAVLLAVWVRRPRKRRL